MPTFRGKPACDCLVAWIPAFEAKIGKTITWTQLVGDAPASAGFHKGGGSADCRILTTTELRVARNMGGAAWNRYWTDNHHCHIRLNGCPHNSVAQPQVEDLNEGRDGTGPLYDNAGVPDNGPRDGVKWPLRTWREGIEWSADMNTAELTAVLRSEGVSGGGDENNNGAVQTWSKIDALSAKIDRLAVDGIDLDALALKVADVIAARMQS